MKDPEDSRALYNKIDVLTRKIDSLSASLNASPGIRSLPVAENTALIRLESGLKLYIDSRDIGVGSYLLTQGTWESGYVAQARKLIRPGTTRIDIGANLGFYSVTLASLTGRSDRLLAFEPNPHLHGLVEKSLKLNGFSRFASAHQIALAEKKGRATLRFKIGDFGGGSLYIDGQSANSDFSACDVDVRTLADFDIKPENPIFIKIDSEGAEYNILRGAEALLKRAKDVWIMMEFTPTFIKRHLPVELYIKFLTDQRSSLHLWTEKL